MYCGNWKEKEGQEGEIYIYVWLIHFVVQWELPLLSSIRSGILKKNPVNHRVGEDPTAQS